MGNLMILQFSAAVKFNPTAMEKIIEGHSLVSSAAILGQYRFQSALPVEPNQKQWDKTRSEGDFIYEIQLTVKESNASGSGHGHITKSMIKLALPEKPLTRTVKGSVQRHQTQKDYVVEPEILYANEDEELGMYFPDDKGRDDISDPTYEY